MKRQLIATLLALLFVGCSAMAVFTAAQMGRVWGDRATGSIGSKTYKDLMVLTALHPDLGWTAYAQSTPKEITSDALPTRNAKAAVLCFQGEPERIAFFPVTSGRLPLDGERGACALDEDTAFRLFNSVNVDGDLVRLDGKTVRVVGVIDVDRPIVLVPAAQDAVLDRLVADDRNALLTMAIALEIETDPFELNGAELVRIMWLLCALPWLLAVAQGLAMLRKRGDGWRIVTTALLWVLSLGALLVLLLSVPVRLLPARWSDLAFYGEQLAAFRARPFRVPDVRDAMLNSDILRVGLLSAAACIALWMERMWLRCEKSR